VASGDFALTIGPLVPAKDLAGFRAWLKAPATRQLRLAGRRHAAALRRRGDRARARRADDARALPRLGAVDDRPGRRQIAAMVSPVTEALELHKAGRVRIVATTGATRSPFVDGVPTLKEPASTSRCRCGSRCTRRRPARGHARPAARRRAPPPCHAGADARAARRLGLVPAPSTAAELLALQQRESRDVGPVVKASGFTPAD
jgi:hypothetical protein